MLFADVLCRTDVDDAGVVYFGTNINWKTTGTGWAMILDKLVISELKYNRDKLVNATDRTIA